MQTLSNFTAQYACAQNADGKIFPMIFRQRLPMRTILLDAIIVKTSKPMQHLTDSIFLHLLAHTGIFQAKKWNRRVQHFRVCL
ncbi:Uncharacterised protein [Shigella sonnei]|nr:Uncharacterised protein [Shigella sonnei]